MSEMPVTKKAGKTGGSVGSVGIVVMGLDLSLTQTGVAIRGGAEIIRTPASRLDGPSRLVAIRDRIKQLIDLNRVDFVCLEGYSFGSKAGRERLGELGGVIRVLLHEQGVEYLEVPPTSLKMFATGHGNAKKPEVISAARERLGYTGFNDNEADALWLEVLGRHLRKVPLISLPKSHLRALDKLQTR